MTNDSSRVAWEAEVARLLQGDGAKTFLESREYKKAVADRLALQEKEETIREAAPWFGTTGLPEETERELPRYLRREFGQTIFDTGALKAADLVYVGRFSENREVVRYWHIAYENETAYAYVVRRGKQEYLGWGGRRPPNDAKQ